MSNKAIIHLDLDTFFVSCERRLNSSLENKPVIVGGVTDRGVVACCSYEARRYGITAMMPMKLAKRLCPEAVIIKGQSGSYSKFSNLITQIIKENAPLYEKASFDEFYVDMTGMDHFFGTYKWATELRQKIIKESGLPLSFGLSTSKTVSKVGTGEAKPNNQLRVLSGEEKQFLAPLSVEKIPLVGSKTFQTLKGLGIEHVGTVQKMPMAAMRKILGDNGRTIWERSNGIDLRPVIAYNERKSISIERTFERDTINLYKLRSILIAMAENLAFQLRSGNKLTACVTVRLRYADLNVFSKQLRIPFTASDATLINTAKELFAKLYDRRQMVRLISVRYSHLVEGAHQISLFEDTEELCNLNQAMDKMRKRYGQDAVKRAIAMGSNNIGRMNPFTGEPPVIPAHRRA